MMTKGCDKVNGCWGRLHNRLLKFEGSILILLYRKTKACSAIFNYLYVITVVSAVASFANFHNLACATCTLLLQNTFLMMIHLFTDINITLKGEVHVAMECRKTQKH